jgi:UDPglucose 6-dehydrogenase
VVGLTFKEKTHSLKNSPSIALLERLHGHAIIAYDPVAAEDAVGYIARAESATAAMQGADVVLVMTPWPEFSSISIADLADSMAGRVVIDPYRMLDGKELVQGGFTYATIGEPIRQSGL